MADMEKLYDDLIIINLYDDHTCKMTLVGDLLCSKAFKMFTK